MVITRVESFDSWCNSRCNESMSRPTISKDILDNILRHDEDLIVQTSLAFTRCYEKEPWNTPLVRLDDIPLAKKKERQTETFAKYVTTPGRNRFTRRKASGVKDFIIRNYPSLKSLNFNDGTVIVAGGAVVSTIVSTGRGCDADLFILQTTAEGCRRVEDEISKKISGKAHQIIKSVYTTTYTRDDEIIQIIKRGYRNAAQVIACFDLSSCKFFYDGQDVFTTLDGAIALYHGINIVDWRVESPSFWSRLVKWQKRGFRILCPCLCAVNLPRDMPGAYPYHMNGVKIGVKQNKITFQPEKHSDISDYSTDELDYDKTHTSIIVGAAIRKDPRGIYLFARQKKKSLKHCGTETVPGPMFTRVVVFKVFEQILGKFPYLSNEATWKFHWGEFYPAACVVRGKIVGSEYILRTCPNVSPFSNEGCQGPCCEAIRVILDAETQEYLDLIKRRASQVQTYLDEIYTRIEISEYKLENPGEQFRGAFNPIIRQHPRDFWGPKWVALSTTFLKTEKMAMMCAWKFPQDRGISGFWRLPKDVVKYIFGVMDILYIRDVLSTGLLAYGARVARPLKKVVEKPKVNASLLALVRKLAGENPKELADTLKIIGLGLEGTFESIANITKAIPDGDAKENSEDLEEMPEAVRDFSSDECSCDECLGVARD